MIKEYLPQPEGYPHAHCASLITFKDNLYCLWYVYHEEEYQNARLCVSSFNQIRGRWSPSQLIFEQEGGKSQGNATAFIHNNQFYILYVTLEGLYWNSSKLHLASFNPNTSKAENICSYDFPQGIMVRHRPIVNGDKVLIPAYLEEEKQTVILEGNSPFTELSIVGEVEPGPIQGALIKESEKDYTLILRGTSSERKVARAHSADSGKTWPYLFNTPFECPLSGVAALKGDEGSIYIAHNNTSEHKRSPLSLSVSQDKLKSLYKSLNIETGDGEFSYPDLIEDGSGNLHLVYTHDRERIGHYRFNKESLAQLK